MILFEPYQVAAHVFLWVFDSYFQVCFASHNVFHSVRNNVEYFQYSTHPNKKK
jgi:hypothetical protein